MGIIKIYFSKISKYLRHRKQNLFYSQLKKKYCGSNITIISNSCLGGVIYHQLGLRFNSPTINMWIEMEGFLSFCRNIESYLTCEVKAIDLDCNYPTGIIKPDQYEPMIIHFNHYRSFKEAKHKWDERKTRIISDKIVVFFDASAMKPINNTFIDKWKLINYPKMAFGCLKRDDIPNYYYIDFNGDIQPSRLCQYHKRGRLYLNQVDFVAFLNNSFKK